MHPRIHSDPAVMMGKPVIKGTRIAVQHILQEIESGSTFENVIEDYPHLTIEDVRAALAYAADLVGLPERKRLAAE